LVQW